MTFSALCSRVALATALVVGLPIGISSSAAQTAGGGESKGIEVPSSAKVGGGGWKIVATPSGPRLMRVSYGAAAPRTPTAEPGDAPAPTGVIGPVTGDEGAPVVAPLGAPLPLPRELPGDVRPLVGGAAPRGISPRPTVVGDAWAPAQTPPGMAAPAAPTGAAAQSGAGGAIEITWTDNSSNETAFQVQRQRQSGENWVRSTTLLAEANATSLTDHPGNGVFRYRVRAVNPGGSSEFTEWVTVSVTGLPPSGPSHVALSDLGNGRDVRIAWVDNSADETGFEIQRERENGGSWGDQVTLTAAANTTSLTDQPGLGTFRYRVRAMNNGGASAFTPWAMIAVSQTAPAAPTNLQVSDQGNNWHMRVTWTDASNNESHFEVQRQAQTESGWGLILTNTLPANSTSWTDSVGPGTYRYRARAINSFGASAYTPWVSGTVVGSVATAPSAPTGVMASDVGNRRALVSWTDTSNNETGFEIERSPSFAGGTVQVAANTSGYIDQCGPGTFSYRVRAVNSAGASAYSAWASVTVAEIAPAAPTGLTAAAEGNDGVVLSWTDNSNNESGFRIERQTQTGETWGQTTTLTAPADATSYHDTPGEGMHRYRIAATNFAGDSAFTGWVTVGVSGGWTVLVPSPDSRMVYVSSSQGNDNNDGLSPDRPKKTIAAAYALMRQGYPDWMLLKRGDVWVNETLGGSNGSWQRSGRSAAEPMVVTSYGPGTARPMLKTNGSTPGIAMLGNSVSSISNLAFVGIELYAHQRNPNDPAFISGSGGAGAYPYGVRYIKAGSNILFEDMKISYYGLGMDLELSNDAVPLTDVKIRRCVITDCYSGGSAHSQGIYASGLDRFLIEECVFDHNGWNEQVSGAVATIYNRNLYLSQNLNLVCRGIIDHNGASGGMQMRRGGLAEKNLSINNPVALQVGHANNDRNTSWTAVVRYNVAIGARDVEDIPHAWGYGVGPGCAGMDMYENIVTRNNNGTGSIQAYFFNGGGWNTRNVDLHDNIAYRWDYNGEGHALQFASNLNLGNVRIRNNTFYQRDGGRTVNSQESLSGVTFSGNRYWSASSPNRWFRIAGREYNFAEFTSLVGEQSASSSQPTYPDPNRDVSTYMASIGRTPSVAAFMEEARKQSKANWRPEFTSTPVINHIRAGFGLPPVP